MTTHAEALETLISSWVDTDDMSQSELDALKKQADEAVKAVFNPDLLAWQIAAAAGEFMDTGEIFKPIADMAAWEAFKAENSDALNAIADEATVFQMACNCELLIGGGASPLFRVGFVD